jgi:ABC-type Fe3+ transport system substrate-binding protein
MPRLNQILFIAYIVATVVVLIVALLSPAFRAIAYAPLRDALLPPPEPITISVLYSTEKEAWIEETIAQFEATRPQVEGHPLQVTLSASGSREMYLAVLDGAAQPDVISPASSLQIAILEDLWTRKYGASIVKSTDTRVCRSVLRTPLVLIAWRERADLLWGSNPGRDVWSTLHDALVDPQGWAAFGRPEWSFVKFGHTDPLKSNSGFMTILLLTYDYLGKRNGLTAADILSNPDFQEWFTEIEETIANFGDSTGTYMRDMIAFGPSVYDVVAVYEATGVEHAENAIGRYGELRVYYPAATVMSDHPFCILNAAWVSPQKAEGARLFIDYLLSRPAQELGLIKYGFRPVDPSIPIDQPDSPFNQYAAYGFHVDLPPEVEVPAGDVLDTLLNFWSRTIRR